MVFRRGKYGEYYGCSAYPQCSARIPMDVRQGALAVMIPARPNDLLLTWKIKASESFERLMRMKKVMRADAVEWLAQMLGVQVEGFTIGKLDVEGCKKVIEICSKYQKPVKLNR
jgi:ssDNA-binding Zn-finger/Zn-ribbon topoisomerase 1